MLLSEEANLIIRTLVERMDLSDARNEAKFRKIESEIEEIKNVMVTKEELQEELQNVKDAIANLATKEELHQARREFKLVKLELRQIKKSQRYLHTSLGKQQMQIEELEDLITPDEL